VQQVTGLMDLTGRVARVAGPGAAGLLLLVVPAVGLYAVDAVDAVTFAMSALLLTRIAGRVPQASAERAGPEKATARRGSGGRVLLRRSPW
jgi:hypothetical protein